MSPVGPNAKCENVRLFTAVRVQAEVTRSEVCVRGETFQFSVEAQRFFQKGGMTDALVPRHFRGFAVVQYVVGHGWEHHSVRAAMSNEDGHCNSFKERRKIKFALNHSAAHAWFYYHIESQDFLEIVLRDWLGRASAQESANCRNVGRKIVLTGARCVFQKARPHKWTSLRAKDDSGGHKIDPGNLSLAVS